MDPKQEKELLGLFRRLSAEQRAALVEKLREAVPKEPDPGRARVGDESVVAALRRLCRRYPALDRRRLIAASADLLAAHMLHDRPAAEVITELEALFLAHYLKTTGAAK